MTAQRSRTGVGIIGCGNISNVYAAKLSALPFIDLVACADVLPDPAKELAERHGIPKVLEPDGLIADDDVEVVVNLTIPAAHYPVSRRVVDSGKSVFCEKPLALTLDEGLELGRAAKEMGVRVGCAPDTFLGGGLQTCRKLIDDGAIGEPVAASGFMLSPGPESWHPGPAAFYQRGAGPLFDMGPYYLTALVHLLGPVRRITGSARITHAQREIGSEPLRGQMMDVEVPTHVAAILDFASGPVANLTTSGDGQTTRRRNSESDGSEHLRRPGDDPQARRASLGGDAPHPRQRRAESRHRSGGHDLRPAAEASASRVARTLESRPRPDGVDRGGIGRRPARPAPNDLRASRPAAGRAPRRHLRRLKDLAGNVPVDLGRPPGMPPE